MAGYIIDLIGSEIVVAALDRMQDELAGKMKSAGLNITNRYSPGDCGWPVTDQHKLFSLFPEKFCGISLSESSLMHPIKSVSGIIGIGKDVRKTAYACDLCEMETCVVPIQEKYQINSLIHSFTTSTEGCDPCDFTLNSCTMNEGVCMTPYERISF